MGKESRESGRLGLNNHKYSTISRYVLATAVGVALIAYATVRIDAIVGGLASAVAWLADILTPLVVGGLFAVLLWPAMRWVERRLGRIAVLKGRPGVAHVLAVLVVSLAMLGLIAIMVSVLISVITNTMQSISFEGLGSLIMSVVGGFRGLTRELSSLLQQLGYSEGDVSALYDSVQSFFLGETGSITTTVASSVDAIREFLSGAAFALVFTVYFLLDGENLSDYWGRALHSLLGDRPYGYFSEFLDDARRALTGYMRGQFIDALMMAFVVTVALSLLDVRYAALIGMATGVGNLIPYVGPIVAYAGTVLACVIEGDFTKLVVSVIVLFVIQFIDGQIVNPRILGDTVEVHPILVIVALIAGGKVGGVVGMFLAVPVAALVRVYFERLVAWRSQKTGIPDERLQSAGNVEGAQEETSAKPPRMQP